MKRIVIAAVFSLFLPVVAQAGTLALDLTGGSSSTTGTDYSAGWSFTTGSLAIDVTALDGLVASGVGQQVRLYGANQVTIASATIVSGTLVGIGADFYSVAITPAHLAANTTYYVAEDLPNGTPYVYLGNTVVSPAITFGAAVANNVLGQNPTSDITGGGFNPAFFGPSFEFTASGPLGDVPEIDPGSAASAFALLSMGLALVNGRRRKTA